MIYKDIGEEILSINLTNIEEKYSLPARK